MKKTFNKLVKILNFSKTSESKLEQHRQDVRSKKKQIADLVRPEAISNPKLKELLKSINESNKYNKGAKNLIKAVGINKKYLSKGFSEKHDFNITIYFRLVLAFTEGSHRIVENTIVKESVELLALFKSYYYQENVLKIEMLKNEKKAHEKLNQVIKTFYNVKDRHELLMYIREQIKIYKKLNKSRK